MTCADVKTTGANVELNVSGVASASRGLVGDTVFAVLPNIRPAHTFIATLLFQSVSSRSVQSHLRYSLRVGLDLPCKVVACTKLQELPCSVNDVRLVVVHVRVACP